MELPPVVCGMAEYALCDQCLAKLASSTATSYRSPLSFQPDSRFTPRLRTRGPKQWRLAASEGCITPSSLLRALRFCSVSDMVIYVIIKRHIADIVLTSFGYDQGDMGGVNTSPDYVRIMKLG